jgi:tRNA(Ile)-lysidine synthase TilS/MesJ
MSQAEPRHPAVSLMFSGGVDSTTAALQLAERFDRVHLLTFQNGYGHTKIHRSAERVKEIERHAGPRFSHLIESIQPLFDELLMDNLRAEYRRWGSGFVWCLSCKLAMHSRSILYNLEHGIPVMADGSSSSTGEMVEQSLLSLYMFREMYAEHGIRFTTPVYAIPREEEIERLKARGFRMGFRIRDRFLRVQPKCRPGELYYLPFLLFDQPPKHDEDKVAAFLEEKRVVARAWIERRCEQLGVPSVLPGGEEE